LILFLFPFLKALNWYGPKALLAISMVLHEPLTILGIRAAAAKDCEKDVCFKKLYHEGTHLKIIGEFFAPETYILDIHFDGGEFSAFQIKVERIGELHFDGTCQMKCSSTRLLLCFSMYTRHCCQSC
jgi:hypothetical protein